MTAAPAAAAALLAAALGAALAPAAPGEPARAPPRAVLSRAERSEVRLGEPFRYEVELRHAPDERVVLAPELDAPPFRGSGGACARTAVGDEVRTTCALRLALFALGPHDVPELRARVTGPRGEATVAVPGPRVTGVGILAPDAPAGSLALRELAPPVPLRVRSLRLLLWAAGALALLAAALVVRRVLSARARAAVEPPAPEPPAARLLRRLEALDRERLPAREHFFELSAIVREWVGAVSGVNALDLTTAELCERLARTGDPRLDVDGLGRFLERADLVKFAGAGADAAERAAATQWARSLAAFPTPTAAGASRPCSPPASGRRSTTSKSGGEPPDSPPASTSSPRPGGGA